MSNFRAHHRVKVRLGTLAQKWLGPFRPPRPRLPASTEVPAPRQENRPQGPWGLVTPSVPAPPWRSVPVNNLGSSAQGSVVACQPRGLAGGVMAGPRICRSTTCRHASTFQSSRKGPELGYTIMLRYTDRSCINFGGTR